MTLEAIFVFALVLVVFIAFIWEKYPPEVIALASSAILMVVGILDTGEFLSVFSSSAPITIAMMFIISAALERTGVLQIISNILKRSAKGSYLRSLLVIMFFSMISSAFMNNTPIVIMLTPVVISLAASVNMAPSKLLIPLSFASIFGGTLTLVGTSTNILMSSVAIEQGQPEVSMFEMTIPGLIFASVGVVYMLIMSKFLLPERYSLAHLVGSQPKRKFIAEVLIPHDSNHIGKPIPEFPLPSEDAIILDMIRRNFSVKKRMKDLTVKAGDRFVINTNASDLLSLKENGQIEFGPSLSEDFEPVSATQSLLMEASISEKSSLMGRKISDLALGRKYGVYVVAVHRNDENLENFENLELKFADTLLLEGSAEGLKRLMEDGKIINLTEPQDKPVRKSKAPIAFFTIIGVMALAAMNVMPIAGLAIIGATIVMITRCVDPEEAFDAIDWRILFLIFGMLGLSIGMEKTGAAGIIVNGIVSITEGIGPVGLLLTVYALTSLLTEMISNNAVAVLIGPLVIALAEQLGLDPRPFIMAVMFAASASFATPIGYQTNTFVYGAGGYKFKDFLKIGIPLNIIFALLSAVILPMFFPF